MKFDLEDDLLKVNNMWTLIINFWKLKNTESKVSKPFLEQARTSGFKEENGENNSSSASLSELP